MKRRSRPGAGDRGTPDAARTARLALGPVRPAAAWRIGEGLLSEADRDTAPGSPVRTVRRVAYGLLAVLCAVPGAVDAQAGRSEAREGNRLYQEGRFEEAHQRYLEALAADPDSPLLNFNDGNALYQHANLQRAVEAYQRAIESAGPELQAAAWYNLGNTLYRAQQLQQSLEAYKEALRRDPTDVDAKHNLERVLEQMEQQQQSQGGGDPNEDEQEPDDQDGQGGGQQPPPEGEQEQDPPEDGQDPREGEDSGPQDPQQDGEQPGDEPSGPGEPPQDGQPRPGESAPQSGPMTPEEAERLLDAIEEDPDEVDRRRAAATGRQPRKRW